MDLNEFFGPHPIVIDLQAENRWEAIEELIDYLEANGKIKTEHRDAILQSVIKRESSMSSGIGYGVGIPHAPTPLVSEPIGAIGVSTKGIQFDALDNKLVKVVMLFLMPEGQFQKHLDTLANVAKLLHRPDFRKWLSHTTESHTAE